MFDISKFHEREDVRLLLPAPLERHLVTSYFESVGFHVEQDSDFAYLSRDTGNSPWQASDVTQVDFQLNAQPSLPPNPIDSLNFIYLLATLPASVLPEFMEIIGDCQRTLGGGLWHHGRQLDQRQLAELFCQYVDDLRSELSDEPGTDFVARILYEFSPRPITA